MASEVAEPLATNGTTSDADDDGSSASGSELSSTGAVPRDQDRTCRPSVPPGWRPPNPDDLIEMALLADARQGERGQSSGGRGRPEYAESADASSSDEASSAGQSCAEPGGSQLGEQAEAAVQPATKAALAARAKQVFDASATWPTEVRQPLLAPVATNQAIRDAIAVCNDLCNRDGEALSKAFGNFDRRVALGWLLADAAGMPLLSRPQAHALGIKAQRADRDAKAAIRDARKRAMAPARAAGADISQAQDDAETAVLRADAKLIMPHQSPPAAHAARERAGSRKRAREPEPSHHDEVQKAEASLLQAEKVVSRAEKALEKAEAASDAAFAKVRRIAACSAEHESMSSAQVQEHAHKMNAACTQSDEADMAEKDAEIALLRAELAERDTHIDLLMLQWGHTCQKLDSAVATASAAVSSAKTLCEIPMFRSSDLGSTVESDDDP